ncbi:MAG: putative quinol monooxygenase [bacterium]
MFMRVVQAKMNPEKIVGIERVYKEKILPELQKTPGCLCARLIQSSQEPNEFLSMTLWDTQKHAENYEKGGLFQKLLDLLKPFMSDPTEWKIQLSEDFALQFEPVAEDPVVTSYPVVEESVSKIQPGEEAQSMHMRMVSPKIQPGKFAEFKKLYKEEIIPAFFVQTLSSD